MKTIYFSSPDYDTALIGQTIDKRAVYDYYKMVDYLVNQGMTEDDAMDFISFNSIGLDTVDNRLPIIVFPIEDLDV